MGSSNSPSRITSITRRTCSSGLSCTSECIRRADCVRLSAVTLSGGTSPTGPRTIRTDLATAGVTDERSCSNGRIDRRRTARVPPRSRVHRRGGARAARPRRVLPSHRASRRRRLPREHRGGGADREPVRPASLSHDSVRDRDVARRPRPGAARRGFDRRDENGRDPRSERRGSRLPHSARGEAQAAQRVPARHRPVLPDRSGGRRVARRDDRHARIGDERGAVRNDARERSGIDGRARRRPHREDRGARAQVRSGLRPHPGSSWARKARWA